MTSHLSAQLKIPRSSICQLKKSINSPAVYVKTDIVCIAEFRMRKEKKRQTDCATNNYTIRSREKKKKNCYEKTIPEDKNTIKSTSFKMKKMLFLSAMLRN